MYWFAASAELEARGQSTARCPWTMPVVMIVLVGISGAVVFTVVYATGTRAATFTALRLALAFTGLLLVTVPLPLMIYLGLGRGRQLAAVAVALFVLAVIALALGAPDDPSDEP